MAGKNCSSRALYSQFSDEASEIRRGYVTFSRSHNTAFHFTMLLSGNPYLQQASFWEKESCQTRAYIFCKTFLAWVVCPGFWIPTLPLLQCLLQGLPCPGPHFHTESHETLPHPNPEGNDLTSSLAVDWLPQIILQGSSVTTGMVACLTVFLRHS